MPDDPAAFENLRDATRRLYHVFGRIRGESHWVDQLDNKPADYCALPAQVSVRYLSLADVNYFFSHAVCIYPPDDPTHIVQYFLPRVLEEWAQEEGEAYLGLAFDQWFVGKRLAAAQWLTWPKEQMMAVQDWLDAWVDAMVRYEAISTGRSNEWNQPSNRRFSSWLKIAEEADLDSNYLVKSVASAGEMVAVRLADACLSSYSKTLTRYRVLWKADDGAHQKPLKDWLLRYSTEQLLERAFFLAAGRDEEIHISKTLESLVAHKAALPEF